MLIFKLLALLNADQRLVEPKIGESEKNPSQTSNKIESNTTHEEEGLPFGSENKEKFKNPS